MTARRDGARLSAVVPVYNEAPIVAQLFFGGLPAVKPPPATARKRRARGAAVAVV